MTVQADVLQRAEWRNDPDLFFQVGQGRHSAGGRPVLHGAVCDCLEKDMRSSLRAREGLDVALARKGRPAQGPGALEVRLGGRGATLEIFAEIFFAKKCRENFLLGVPAALPDAAFGSRAPWASNPNTMLLQACLR